MKSKILLAAALALCVSAPTFAQEFPVCVTGTLASYIALGAGGCMFNSALYRDFTYASPVSNTITPAEIIVTPTELPLATAPFQGLNFRAPWNAAAGKSEVSIIGYNVVPFPPQAGPATLSADLTLDLGTVTISGIIGSVTITQQSTTSPAATPPGTVNLEVYESCQEVCSIRPTDSVIVSPLTTLQTTLTVTLTGGNDGVSLNNFAANESFAVQPE
ncbi:MAG: hypothetical protein ABR907_13805 [Terracidiphilus sp.]|jgi:hypothetical protein